MTVDSDKKSCRSSSRTMKSVIFYAKVTSHHQSIFSLWRATVRWYCICPSEEKPQGLQGLHRKSIHLSISRVQFNFFHLINNHSHLTKHSAQFSFNFRFRYYEGRSPENRRAIRLWGFVVARQTKRLEVAHSLVRTGKLLKGISRSTVINAAC